MIKRFYINNFRCLENFDLPLGEHSSALLIGLNGAGKTTVGVALEVLQKIARGTNRVEDLVKPSDLRHSGTSEPMRFELEVVLESKIYAYSVALEFPDGFKQLRVLQEKFSVDGTLVFSRDLAEIRLTRSNREPKFSLDWHSIALPMIQEQSPRDSISIFKRWLADTLILRPIPKFAQGESKSPGTLHPDAEVMNLGAWFTGLLTSEPSAYVNIESFLKQAMPDFQDIKNPLIGETFRKLYVQFSKEGKSLTLPFESMSDGEKCFVIFALTIASNHVQGPLLCFWDEPDNFLASSEIHHSVMALRKSFEGRGQLILTSHHPEVWRCFSDENTLILKRYSHLEPTNLRPAGAFRDNGEITGSLADAALFGDLLNGH